MFRKFSTASYSKLVPAPTNHVSAVSEPSISHSSSGKWNRDTLINAISKRRLENSPTLQLEAVALSDSVTKHTREYITRQKLTNRQLRSNAKTVTLMRARESFSRKAARRLGQPMVQPPPAYDPNQAAAFLAARMPGTFSANMFVMAEAARLSPNFNPNSFLDFGSGPGTSFMAASRVFSQSKNVPSPGDTDAKLPTMLKACLVDSSAHMRSLAAEIIGVDPSVSPNTSVTHLSSLQDCQPDETFDIVSCSYSLSEVVREAMSRAKRESKIRDQGRSISRQKRVQLGEKQLRRTAKALWSRTAPNGLLIIIEDGTAAGFETVAFVREAILKTSPPLYAVERNLGNEISEEPLEENLTQVQDPMTRAHVVAPCLHSKSCPLIGSITTHRICRFQQRLNRPPISRTIMPMTTGYEDEYFSFVVIQKLVAEEQEIRDAADALNPQWGRLIRQPLQRTKHITLDACTNEAKLERRVISKKSAPEGMFSKARRAKWGDVWSSTPSSAPQLLNF